MCAQLCYARVGTYRFKNVAQPTFETFSFAGILRKSSKGE